MQKLAFLEPPFADTMVNDTCEDALTVKRVTARMIFMSALLRDVSYTECPVTKAPDSNRILLSGDS
jgi:hypothetical protein